jgi:SH3 domain-containing YSC84-like protein 1
MKYAKLLLLSVALIVSTAFAKDFDKGDEAAKAQNRLNEAASELNHLVNAQAGIPQGILADAKCIAIVPKLVKGGFVIGAEHGRGVATCRVGNSWSAPAFFTITGGSWGAQIGAEGVDLVMLFMNQQGAERLLSANWKIGGDVGIAAGPYGRDASANTSVKLNAGILTYSKAKGAFIGASLDGAHVHADERAIRGFYGDDHSFRELLTGQVTPPPAAQQFVAEIRRDVREAEASK